MGKFRSKLKGQTKGKRWLKGQSSSSNPETHKHRDLAKNRFFQANLDTSSLTSDALRKHDAIQSFLPNAPKNDIEMDEEVESSVASGSSYKTMQSFASDWSACSNMSFSRFMKVFRSDSALHKEMLAILAAITEVIKENGGKETPTEYFCSLLTTLEQVYNVEEKNESQVTAVLSLISMGIKTVPEGVLRTNFDNVTVKMLHILNDYVNSDNNQIIKSIFQVLSYMLKTQDLASWTGGSTNQIYKAILNPFSLHSKPKWRKAAQQAATHVLRSETFANGTNIPANSVAIFCEETLQSCTGSNSGTVSVSTLQTGQTTILHVLGLLKETISYFSVNHIKKCCEAILQLLTLNYPIVTSCGLQVMHSLFSAQKCVVPAQLNAQIITALYEYQPATTDVQPTLAWLAVMQQAHVHLSDVDVGMSSLALPKIFQTVTQLWLSEKAEVMTGATHALEILLKDAASPICQTKESVLQHRSKLEKCFNAIQLGLGYQYNTVWHQVLHTYSIMFEAAGPHCSDLMIGPLKSLAELRDSYKFSYNNELEHAVGAAIRALGPEIVLGVITLKKDNGDLNIDRSWLLPVLKENIKCATLEYFVKGILPLALFCQNRATQLAQRNDGIGAHSSELLYLQLWNLLPCFCNKPTDIAKEFKTIAKVLGTVISDKKELRLAVMAALRKLITSAKESECEEDLKEISRFDKNYLPILFNLYTTKPIGSDEEGQRLAALDTIKVFLSVARTELTQQLFAHALERLNSSSEDPEDSFIKESILDLIRALVSYQKAENIAKLYEQCVKNLPEITNNKEQKKAYRILEEICGSESEGCKEFIKSNRKDVQRLLLKSLNSAAVSSKGSRLRCLSYLIKAQPQLDQDSKLVRSTLAEAVMCCKDINEKCRTMAYSLINSVGEILMSHNQVNEFLALLVAGLAGTPQLMSCTILALTSVLHHFSGALGQDNIRQLLENVCILSTSATREVVASSLSFIKVYSTCMPSPIVAASLPTIMKALVEMTEDCKRHFRLKVRDILDRLIRKYGCESLSPHVPQTDTVMFKRLRNLRKLNARKKKMKDANKDDRDSDDEEFLVKNKLNSVDDILADSDSDFEDMEVEQSKPKQKPSKSKTVNTWIEEDPDSIVDFTDPTVSSKITATKPGQEPKPTLTKKPEKDRGFKTALDGRLIIKDNSSDSDSEKKTSKFNMEDSDSDDNNSIAETLMLADRKRKRSTASVKSGFSAASSQHPPTKYKTGGIGIHRPLDSSSSVAGSEYKSRKASGDVKKKGKVDPYAYLPLQKSALNKRLKKKSGGQFKNIIKAAKAGALKGAKAKKNRKL
ncbi:unnamed protein product [Brassicogethes aeneus]|uniref:RRP12-like protein n=1 Tax=Brassicogethes aeneus TaxID=1431903 RepID=A0A9P0FG06_BRAAE|nr:unnamed protein product [Brassicogethes aeneus]